MKDGYWTVREETRAEITIKRSVFRAILIPQQSKDSALTYLDSLRKEYWDAVHHCYAYRLGPHGLDYRMSDDGEPSGTAGKPILFALQRADVSDALLVVVRWFGGTKLGVGPLARAYSQVASEALERCERVFIQDYLQMIVHVEYDDVSRITLLLQEFNCLFEPTYADTVSFSVSVPSTLIDSLAHEIIERTNGRAGYSKISAE